MLQKLRHLMLALGLVLAVGAPVLAHEGHEHTDRTTAVQRAQGRLEAARKQICEVRSANIVSTMARALQQAEKHLATFDTILKRAQTFYTEKQLTVTNYDALLATVATKKAAAQNAIDTAKTASTFSCGSDNPIGTVEAFRTNLKAIHQAVKEYRAAIIELLTAIKQAARAQEGGN